MSNESEKKMMDIKQELRGKVLLETIRASPEVWAQLQQQWMDEADQNALNAAIRALVVVAAQSADSTDEVVTLAIGLGLMGAFEAGRRFAHAGGDGEGAAVPPKPSKLVITSH